MDAPARWLNEEEQRTWRAWLAMAELVRAQIARDLLVDTGLSDADFTVLVHLSEHAEHRLRMTELADRLGWSRSRLSHQVARMEGRGLLVRTGCPSDARGAFAALTAEGMTEIQRAAPRHVESVRRVLIDVLDHAQLAQLRDIAEIVVANVMALPDPARPSGSLPPCPPDATAISAD